MSIVFRTAGPWGAGQGSDLAPASVDNNFWELLQSVSAISGAGAGIDYFVINGNNLYVHLTNHQVIGPYELPTSNWNFRGQWQAGLPYQAFDVVTDNGSVYLVLENLTSAATFNPGATDGSGNPLYGLLLSQPTDQLPLNGQVGQMLVATGESPNETEWANVTRNLAIYIEGQPTSGETVLQYVVPEVMEFPQGLIGSVTAQGVETITTVEYTIAQNGIAIGTINFQPSPIDGSFTFPTAVTFNPGDVLTITAPNTPDASQSNISITLQAIIFPS